MTSVTTVLSTFLWIVFIWDTLFVSDGSLICMSQGLEMDEVHNFYFVDFVRDIPRGKLFIDDLTHESPINAIMDTSSRAETLLWHPADYSGWMKTGHSTLNTHFSILSSVCSINTIYRKGTVMRLQNTKVEKHYNEGLLIQDEYSYKTFFLQ